MCKKIFGMLSLVAALILTSCGTKESYLEAIPADAVIIGKINIGQALEKSEIIEDPMVKQGINALTGFLPTDLSEMVKDIAADPKKSGIDISKPVVFALDNVTNTSGVATLAVCDKNKLEELLTSISENKELGAPFTLGEGDGFKTIIANGDIVFGAFDDKKLVISGAQHYIDAGKYMRLKSEKQAVNSDKFTQFFDEKSDIAIAYDYDQLMGLAAIGAMASGGADMSSIAKYTKGMVATVAINFEKGAVVSKVSTIGGEDYEKMYNKFNATASGDFLQYIPQSSIAVFSAAIKNIGDLLDECLPADNKAKISQQIADNNLDWSLTDLNEFEGDIMGALLPFELCGNQEIPMGVLMVNCKGRKTFDVIVQTVTGSLEQIDTDVYALKANKYVDWDKYNSTGVWEENYNGTDFYLGLKDNVLFLVPSTLYSQIFADGKLNKLGQNFTEARLFDEVNGKTSVVFDIKAFFNEPTISQLLQENKIIADRFDYLEVYNKNCREGRIVLHFTDKTDNALKQIVDMAKLGISLNN